MYTKRHLTRGGQINFRTSANSFIIYTWSMLRCFVVNKFHETILCINFCAFLSKFWGIFQPHDYCNSLIQCYHCNVKIKKKVDWNRRNNAYVGIVHLNLRLFYMQLISMKLWFMTNKIGLGNGFTYFVFFFFCRVIGLTKNDCRQAQCRLKQLNDVFNIKKST